jgi:hypothetical protein
MPANSTTQADPLGNTAGLDKRRICSSGGLVVSDLDRIMHVNNVGNQKPRNFSG